MHSVLLAPWLAMIAIIALGSPAHADKDERAVLVVLAPAEAGSPVPAAMQAAIEVQHWSAAVSESGELGDKLAKCLARADEAQQSACAARSLRKLTAPTVLFVRAESSRDDEGEPRVVLYGRLMERKTGQTLRTTERHCVRCHGEERLVALAGELATELIRRRAQDLAPHTEIKIVATPKDALVKLGELEAGPAGTYRVPPGPLEVTIYKDGYQPVTKLVELRPNQTMPLEIELIADAPVLPENGEPKNGKTPEPGSRSITHWLVGGAGVASLGLGVTWMVRHQDSIQDGALLPRRRNSMTRGIVASSLGAVLIGTGAVLWYRDRARNRARGGAEAAAPPVLVAPTEDGAVIMWSGWF